MTYKKEWDKLNFGELVQIAEAEGVKYNEDGESLNAEELRVKLGKKSPKFEG